MISTRRIGLAVAATVVLGVALALYWRGYHRAYPYGSRPAALPIVVNALRGYASEHNQSFPNVNNDPYRSLEALFPSYLSARYLAGLSGDERKAELLLRNNGHLSPESCSLSYIPGLLLSDDPRIAIVWENHSGIAFNGRSCPGRAVGFISGEVRQIADREWEQFVSEQASMRESASRLKGTRP